MEFIEIDGSEGEGGGQMVRTALTLSAVTGRAFRIINIRANRPEPGLRSQHLQAVFAARDICSAAVEGAEKSSRALSFVPGKIAPGKHDVNIGTAGSTSLVLQTIALPLSMAEGESEVTITGGTHVEWAPTYDYLAEAWLPLMRRIGLDIDLELVAPGFYPKGGGQIRATIRPAASLAPLVLTERGDLKSVRVLAAVNNLPVEIAERFVKRADSQLRSRRIRHVKTAIKTSSAVGRGTYLRILADYENIPACFTGLGRIGKQAESIADETVEEFIEFHRSGATVDAHMADQLLLPLALSKGDSAFTAPRISPHFQTNSAVIAKFLPVAVSTSPADNLATIIQIATKGVRPL
jgi:RNA 3'-terminal phosphate cyclase (ATP)